MSGGRAKDKSRGRQLKGALSREEGLHPVPARDLDFAAEADPLVLRVSWIIPRAE